MFDSVNVCAFLLLVILKHAALHALTASIMAETLLDLVPV